MALSISDIAKAAGVSTTTVSRVINESPKLKPETREKVKRVMAELNYSPNLLARGLSNSRVFNIGLLIDVKREDFFNPFFYEVMHGIEKAVMDMGYCLIIVSTTIDSKLAVLDRMISEKRIAGVLIPSTLVDGSIIKSLNEKRFPFVVIGEVESFTESCSWVDVNNMQGGITAVNHLYENGYRKIAFMSNEMEHLFNRKRLEGYKKAVEALGLGYEISIIRECDGTKEDACRTMKELLRDEPSLDAIVCGDNIISFGVLKAVNDDGKNIPGNIGLVTFDSYPLAKLLEPTLTSINIDVLQLGALAADALLNMIDNPGVPEIQSLISTTIECRESSKGLIRE